MNTGVVQITRPVIWNWEVEMRPFVAFVAMLLVTIGQVGAEDGTELQIVQAHKEQALAETEIPSIDADLDPRPPLTLKGGPTCVSEVIQLNTTVHGVLETTDCALFDGTFADFWTFGGTLGDEVVIDLISSEFDTFLFLIDPTLAVVDTDDDGGDGTNSRIVATLDATGEWAIAANNLLQLPGDPGNYTLTLVSSAGIFRDGFESGDLVEWSTSVSQ